MNVIETKKNWSKYNLHQYKTNTKMIISLIGALLV